MTPMDLAHLKALAKSGSDADFSAVARSAVPELIAEIERLRAAYADLEAKSPKRGRGSFWCLDCGARKAVPSMRCQNCSMKHARAGRPRTPGKKNR